MPRSVTEDDLFAAFLAGFEASLEGCNGGYVDESLRGDGVLEAYLRREYFSSWLEGRALDEDH